MWPPRIRRIAAISAKYWLGRPKSRMREAAPHISDRDRSHRLLISVWAQTELILRYPGRVQRALIAPAITTKITARSDSEAYHTVPIVTVTNEDILDVARRILEAQIGHGYRVAVLNTASASKPSGGVREGAGAQELLCSEARLQLDTST